MLDRSSLTVSAVLVLSGLVPAQVPIGWAAMSTFKFANATTEEGGVVLFDPSVPGVPMPVTGLPADLTGANNSGLAEGASSVLIRARDGALIVGEHANTTQPSVDIHVIIIDAGAAVVTQTAWSVGSPSNNGAWVDQMAWLPGDRVLFSYRNLTNPALSGVQGLGVLDLATGVVTQSQTTFFPTGGTINALAASRDGQTAYFGVFGLGSSPSSSQIWSVAIDEVTAQSPQLVTAATGNVLNLGTDNDGGLLIGKTSGTGPDFLKYDFGRQVLTNLAAGAGTSQNVNALTLDRASGDYVALINVNGNLGVQRVAASVPSLLFAWPWTTAGGPGTGFPSGLAIRDRVYEYGAPEPSQNDYLWEMFPSPNGDPALGNLAFELRMSSSPGTAIGVMAVSLGEANGPSPFGRFWIDPGLLDRAVSMLPAALSTVPLPIPNVPAFAGVPVFCQAFHLEGSQVLSTGALGFTIR